MGRRHLERLVLMGPRPGLAVPMGSDSVLRRPRWQQVGDSKGLFWGVLTKLQANQDCMCACCCKNGSESPVC